MAIDSFNIVKAASNEIRRVLTGSDRIDSHTNQDKERRKAHHSRN